MSANKKYFYMKLSENFFDSEKLILLDSYGHVLYCMLIPILFVIRLIITKD